MKKFLSTFVTMLIVFPATVLAGGIVTNTNQSASFIRMPAQDAVVGAEGTYFNPAGLSFLENGFHFSLSNQTISQSRTVKSTYPMARSKFDGDVNAPLFPTLYGVYKTGNMAYSLGVNPIGGGGSANFEEGLPSFEQRVAVLPPTLSAAGISTSQYAMDAAFDGTSLNWGIQLNASYAINQMVAFSIGVRYIIANNTYSGHLKNIMINPEHGLNPNGPGNMVSAPNFFTTLATVSTMAVDSIQPVIEGGGGDFTLNELVAAGQMDQSDADELAAGLGDNYNEDMTASDIQSAYNLNAQLMTGLASNTKDMEVDASQSGNGIVPVAGLHIRVSDQFDFAVKYEHKAAITMTNSTTIDDVGMYPDGAETPNDMPAMLSFGANYKPFQQLQLSGGFHYYFDKNADYGKTIDNEPVTNDEVMDNNFWEAAIGVEYSINPSLIISGGYLRTQTGVKEIYHSDLSHSLSTNSVGAGFKYLINPGLGVNFGVMSTMYESDTRAFNNQGIEYHEEYKRNAFTIALGIDLKI